MSITFADKNETFYKGVCLFKWERSEYHDSDFYMRVWDHDKGIYKDVRTGTTRGAFPDVIETVDATEDVIKLYQEAKKQEAQKEIEKQIQFRRGQYAKMKLNQEQGDRLFDAIGENNWYPIFKLLSSNIRSNFRKSLKEQILYWLSDDNPKYKSPLSNKQIQYL